MDAWVRAPDKVHRYKEIPDSHGSVAALPCWIDIDSFAPETRHGRWVTQVRVKP
jgi:hypothetical protein